MTPRHPGLSAALNKLGRGVELSDEEAGRLERQLSRLNGGSHPAGEEAGSGESVEPVGTATPARLLPGCASGEGTARFAARRGAAAASFYRPAQDLIVSTVGIGTYRGAMDAATDAAYAAAVDAALQGGINLIDTSLNYRVQRSEQSVAAGISRFILAGGRRDEIVVCTKGGFLVPGALTPNTLTAADVAGGIHSLAPAFLADQIQRSRRNLGLETIDVYYLHNPETQLGFLGESEFLGRMRAAFERLEQAVADGQILYYGTATWDGYWDGTLSLRSLVDTAREVAGNGHHFRFVQLPFHLGCCGALAAGNSAGTILEVAAELGMNLIASASVWQARLSEDLPEEIVQAMPGLDSDTQRALQFTRSTPGITSALVGMRKAAHVADNLGVARVLPLAPDEFRRLCAAIA